MNLWPLSVNLGRDVGRKGCKLLSFNFSSFFLFEAASVILEFISYLLSFWHHETTGQLKMPHHTSHFMDLSQRCVFIKWPLRPIGHFFLQQLLKLNEVDKFIYTDLHSHYTCVIKVLIVLTIQRPIWKKFLDSNAKQINWQCTCLIYFSLI